MIALPELEQPPPESRVLPLREALRVERAPDHGSLTLTAGELAGIEALMDSAPCTACGGTGRGLHPAEGECLQCQGEGWTA